MADSPAPVVVLGDIQPDITFQLPLPGEAPDRDRNGPVVSGGGTAANTAVALARLGAKVAFIGCVGADPFGRMVLAELAAEGVDTGGCIITDTAPTPVVFALAQPGGEAALYRWPRDAGADWALSWDKIDVARIRAASWLHTSGVCLRHSPAREAVLGAMRAARESGVPVSFDLNFRSEQRAGDAGLRHAFLEAIAATDVIFGHGEDELMAFHPQVDLAETLRLFGEGTRTVIARHGAHGVTALTPQSLWRERAFPTQVVSTVGAGDAFDGGFIAARVAGRGVATAIAWGQAVASLKIAAGGARALPSRAQLDDFLIQTKAPASSGAAFAR